MTVRGNGFGLKDKSDMNLQESVNVKVTLVAVVACQSPFSRPYQSPHASSSLKMIS